MQRSSWLFSSPRITVMEHGKVDSAVWDKGGIRSTQEIATPIFIHFAVSPDGTVASPGAIDELPDRQSSVPVKSKASWHIVRLSSTLPVLPILFRRKPGSTTPPSMILPTRGTAPTPLWTITTSLPIRTARSGSLSDRYCEVVGNLRFNTDRWLDFGCGGGRMYAPTSAASLSALKRAIAPVRASGGNTGIRFSWFCFGGTST